MPLAMQSTTGSIGPNDLLGMCLRCVLDGGNDSGRSIPIWSSSGTQLRILAYCRMFFGVRGVTVTTETLKKISFFSSDTLEVKNFFEAHNTL